VIETSSSRCAAAAWAAEGGKKKKKKKRKRIGWHPYCLFRKATVWHSNQFRSFRQEWGKKKGRGKGKTGQMGLLRHCRYVPR